MKRRGEILFRALCLGLSAILLTVSLFYAAGLASCNDRAARDKAEAERLREENARLRVRCEFRMSLENIERCAREELGMQPLSAEQLVRIREPVS